MAHQSPSIKFGGLFYLCFDKYRIALNEAVFAVSEKILRQNLTSGQI
nr:MAG TPA: hypothetical protein [Inoviridae sp.]